MIAILAPYARTEVTAAAIRLAEFIGSLGAEVTYVSCGDRAAGVHPAWDHRVRSDKGGIRRAVRGAATVVHFHASPTWYALAAADAGARHVLVPSSHCFGLDAWQRMIAAECDAVVCPTEACYDVVQAAVGRAGAADSAVRVTWAQWDAGVPAVRRAGPVVAGEVRVGVVCDAAAVDFCAPLVIHVADQLLLHNPRLRVTLLAAKAWSRHDHRAVRQLLAAYGDRVACKKVSATAALAREFHAHDWAVFPGVRAEFGILAALALACGTPVVAHDVEPYKTIVRKACGRLVPCDVHEIVPFSPVAVPHLGHWLTTCHAAFSNPKLLAALRAKDWHLARRRQRFDRVWLQALDLCESKSHY